MHARPALLVLLVLGSGCEKSQPSPVPTPAQAVEAPAPPLPPKAEEKAPRPKSVLAADLAAAYSGNEVAGDAKFKKKQVRVFGRVEEISVTALAGHAAVRMGRVASKRKLLDEVVAFVPEERSAPLAEVSVGQVVALDCVATGKTLGSLMLSDCSFAWAMPADHGFSAEALAYSELNCIPSRMREENPKAPATPAEWRSLMEQGDGGLAGRSEDEKRFLFVVELGANAPGRKAPCGDPIIDLTFLCDFTELQPPPPECAGVVDQANELLRTEKFRGKR